MNELQLQVTQSANKLQDAWSGLRTFPARALPIKCVEKWSKRADLHQVLSGTVPLFAAREMAWSIVLSTAKAQATGKEPESVRYGDVEMNFAVARHLSLTAYVSVCWSVYDRLANVCGRLAGTADLAENPKLNPKPCEDLVGDSGKKKDTLGFASHFHLREAYSWPLRVSYKIRNWLVHEGYEEGGTPLFRGDRIIDGFNLHSDAIIYLQKCCEYEVNDGRIGCSCVTKENERWSSGDLIQILELYHRENDTMFAGLLSWTVDSFVQQIRIFAARDQP